MSITKQSQAFDSSTIQEYDYELEEVAYHLCLDDLYEGLQLLKNGDCPIKWAIEHQNKGLLEKYGGDDKLYFAIEAGLDEWAMELSNLGGSIDYNKLCQVASISHNTYWFDISQRHVTSCVALLCAIKGCFRIGCEQAIEMGADDWDEMLDASAKASFQWGCEKAIKMGAKNWDVLNKNSVKSGFLWGFKLSIKMGVTDYDRSIPITSRASFKLGCRRSMTPIV